MESLELRSPLLAAVPTFGAFLDVEAVCITTIGSALMPFGA